MGGVFAAESWVSLLVLFVTLVIAIFAFVNALLFSAESYTAAGKLTKPTWTVILGLALLLCLFPVGFLLLRLAAVIAPLIYLADVRPALAGLYRRR